jgi:predicted RNA polymerase sigma factor
VNESLLRELVPAVIGVLIHRGADFPAAEDAVQDALVEAVRVWPDDPPRDPKGWLLTVAWISAQPPRTRPPHATGRAAQCATAQLSGGAPGIHRHTIADLAELRDRQDRA